MRLGVDVGYGYCKAVSQGGKKLAFPSLVAPDTGRKSWQLLGGEDGQLPYRVRISGHELAGSYAVGEAALQQESAVRAWDTKGQAMHKNSQVLLFTAVAALGIAGDVELGVGLPLEIFGDGTVRSEVSRAVQGISGRVCLGDSPGLQVAFRKVAVFPQAGGAYLNLLLGQDGQIKNPQLLGRTVGVIDVGYRTTDLLLLVKGKGSTAVPDPKMSTTIDEGISRVYRHVWMALQTRVGVPVDLLWVERAFMWNEGAMMFRGQAIDLEPDAQVARESLAALIEGRVKQLWGVVLDMAERVILTGGGGAELFPYLQKSVPGLELDPEPVFSNAMGYLAAMARAGRA